MSEENVQQPADPTAEVPVEAAPTNEEKPIVCYIGKEPIYAAEKDGDFTTVEFAGGKKRMHNLIFDRVIATEANNNGGSVEDMVATTIAREIIALFTVYNLTLGECDVVINYTATNATNAKRSGDKKLWNGKRAEDVTFQDIRNVLS